MGFTISLRFCFFQAATLLCRLLFIALAALDGYTEFVLSLRFPQWLLGGHTEFVFSFVFPHVSAGRARLSDGIGIIDVIPLCFCPASARRSYGVHSIDVFP